MKVFKKKALTFALAVMLAFGMAIPVQATEVAEPASGGGAEGYVEGEAIVCVQESRRLYGRSNAADKGLLARAETLMTLENSTGEATGTDGTSSGGAAALFSAGSGAPVESLKLVKSNDLTTEELIQQLEKLDQVVFAEPNYIYSVADTKSGDYTGQQWGYDTAGDSEFDINIPGWNKNPVVDTTDTVVAVLDTGIDYTHEDLKNVMWTAEGLQSKIGGGAYGYNAVPVDSDGTPYKADDPMDDNSHGTHCAGIIAAEWNEYGVSGATKGAQVMAVKIGNDRGAIMNSSTIKGFEYVKQAKNNGVNVTVTSNSWGGGSSGGQAIDRVVAELGEMGVVSVFASGNDSKDTDINSMTDNMLKNNPYSVIVNATDEEGELTWFSNYGAVTTDVASPGLSILSTIPTSMAKMNALLPTNAAALAEESFGGTGEGTGSETNKNAIKGNLFTYKPESGTTIALDASKDFTDSDSDTQNGDGSLKITPPTDSKLSAITVTPSEAAGIQEDRKYIALRYYGELDNAGESLQAFVQAAVKCEKDEVQDLPSASGSVGKWNQMIIALPDNTDYKNFELKLEMSMMDSEGKEKYNGSVYIDDVKFYGVNAAVPYGYKSGTSMATPAVTGEAAMVAKKFKDDPADKWAARIIGSVKIIGSHKGKSVSEGLVDVNTALEGPYVPVLNNAAADENGMLTVTGYFFGKDKGTLTVSGKRVEITSWGEEKITAKVPAELASGVHRVDVTTSDSKSGHQSFELALPGNLYERIALPADEEFLSLEHSTLTGLGGSLYLTGCNLASEMEIWRYTSEQTKNNGWTKVYQGNEDELTTGIHTVCTWEDQLALIVQEFDADSIEVGDYKIGLFDPKTGKMKTVKACDELQSMGEFSIINNGKDILLIGGNIYDEDGEATPQTAVYKLDVKTGNLEKIGDLKKTRVSPAVAFTAEGDVYVAAGLYTDEEGTDRYVDGLERITPDGTVTTVREKVLPSDISEWESGQDYKYSFATVDGGMMLAGPAIIEDGVVTADVYTLDFDSGSFTPTDKIVSTSRLFEPMAAAYQNAFYVLGNTINVQPHEKVFAVDRTIKTVKQPGDSYVPPKEPDEDTATDTGNREDTGEIVKEYTFKGIGLDGEEYKYKVIIRSGLSADSITDALRKAGFDTPEKIEKKLYEVLKGIIKWAGKKNTKIYDVTLMVKIDGKWVEATKTNFPKGGVPVGFDYPEGIDGKAYDATVIHMFAENMKGGIKAGDTEPLKPMETDTEVLVTAHGLSPFLVHYDKTAAGPGVDPGDSADSGVDSGDSSDMTPWIIIMLLSAAAIATMTVVVFRRRTN